MESPVPPIVREQQFSFWSRCRINANCSLGSGAILTSQKVTPIECLHYAMSLPTSAVITGIDRLELLDQDLEAARTFRPMGRQEISALLARTAELAASGKYEQFKTSAAFDATAHNPHWLG